MRNQALFSAKDKNIKLKCRLLQFLFGALWVKSKSSLNLDNTFFQNFFRAFEKESNN